MKAIILAAGYGSRLYPLTRDTPKCLLTIGGETILERQLRILRNCGVEDITVVAGFHHEKILKYGREVSVVYNPLYEVSSGLFSLWTARDVLNDDSIIMCSDVIFTEEPIKALVADDNPYCLVVRREADTYQRRIKVVDGLIVDASKTIPAEETFGEFGDIVKIKKEGLKVFKEYLFQCAKENSYYAFVETFRLMARKGHKVNFILVKSPYMDIDTKEDYAEAQRIFGED